MTTYYINPSASVNGDGSLANPFNTLTGVPVAAGNVYKIKRGTTWSGTFPTLTPGTSTTTITTVTAYSGSDGSDDPTQAKPILNLGDSAMPGGVNGWNFFKINNIDLRNTRVTIASDVALIFMGNDSEISDCNVSTNLCGIYMSGKARINVLRNTVVAATDPSYTVSMYGIVISGSSVQDSITISDNNVKVGGGGNTSSHGMRLEGYSGGSIPHLKVLRNNLRTVDGLPVASDTKAGIWANNCDGAEFGWNDVSLFLDGLSLNTCRGVWAHHNRLCTNGNFGIHTTTNVFNMLCEWNICRHNGNGSGQNYWGRGIECSAGNAQDANEGHIFRYNDCSYNYNYGGPTDNGSEGCGIGLDDGTANCFIYGNLIYRNEGNGIQAYGGTHPVQTGGHIICNNFFIENATMSMAQRRSSGGYITQGAAHITFANTLGWRSVVVNNLFYGSLGAIRQENTSSGIDYTANVFMNQTKFCIAKADTSNIKQNIYNVGTGVIQIGDLTILNGGNAPVLLSTGVNGDVNTDPLLALNDFTALPGSILQSSSWRSGYAWVSVPLSRNDDNDGSFNGGLNAGGRPVTGDVTPPTFVSGNIINASPTTLTLNLSETLAASVPPTSAFTFNNTNGLGAKISTLRDNFNDNSIATSQWVVGDWQGQTHPNMTVAETSQQLQITLAVSQATVQYAGLVSTNTFNLTTDAAYVRLVQASNQATSLASSEFVLYIDANNSLRWSIFNGNIVAQYTVAGSTSNAVVIAYSSTTHAWFRIREAAGTIFWDTATSSASNPPVSGDWTNRASVANPFAVTALKLGLEGQTFGSHATPGTVIWDGLNTGTASISITGTAVSGSTCTLTLSAPVAQIDTCTIKYTQPGSNPRLQDATGNLTATFGPVAITNAVGDVSPPNFVSAQITAPTQLVMTFDDWFAATTPATSAFTVSPTNTVTSVQVNATTVTLLLGSNYKATDTITVTYTKPGANQLQDLNGNQTATFGPVSVTNNISGDTVPPAYSSSQVANSAPNQIILTFNETLGAVVPATGAFTVSGGKTVSSVAVSANQVQLVVSANYAFGDAITVTYTKPGSNYLQDAAGNATISFGPVTVTNNILSSGGGGGGTPDPVPPTPDPGGVGDTMYNPTRWVDGTNGSDSNAGTSATSAWKTITKAFSTAVAGNVVCVKPGTYKESIYGTNNGTSTSPIIFYSETRGLAKVIPPVTNSTRDSGMDHRGNYVIIDGFEVDGSIDPTSGALWRQGIYITGIGSIARRNLVHHIFRNGTPSGAGGAGIEMEGYYGGYGQTADSNVVHHVGPTASSTSNWYHGIYITATQSFIYNNIISNINEGGGVHGWHDNRNNQVTNNTIFNSRYGMILGGGGYYKYAAPSVNDVVTNNIVVNNTTGCNMFGDIGSGYVYDSNCVWNNGTNWELINATHVNDVTLDPQFVNYIADGSGDYRLKSTSPCIGKGRATYAPTYDFKGVGRSAVPDIGAYTYSLPSDAYFVSSSFWYNAIPTTVTLHASSASFATNFVSQLNAHNTGGVATLDTVAFSSPVYFAPSGQTTIAVSQWNGGYTPWTSDSGLTTQWASVPVPSWADPSDYFNGSMVIYSSSTKTLYEFNYAVNTSGSWKARWGGRLQSTNTGTGVWTGTYGLTSTGISLLGGMITAEELSRGEIKHVMGLSIVDSHATSFSSPGIRTDGNGTAALPQGLRCRLNPSYNVAASTLHPIAKIIATAAQKYGFVIWDSEGSIALRCVNVKTYTALNLDDPYHGSTKLWTGKTDANILAGFPWDQLQFLPLNY